ncbi:MAG: hypothetical protein ACK6BG_09220 [Cyanobacteriota bacterium]
MEKTSLDFMLTARFRVLKSKSLRIYNRNKFRTFLIGHNISRVIVVIVVPGLSHLCIPCVRLVEPFARVVLVDNGLSLMEREWLASMLPGIPFFRLVTSMPWNPSFMTSHGEAMDSLAGVPGESIIFLDPDCYIFEPSLIQSMFAGLESVAITALFSEYNDKLGLSIPDTFCLGIQSRSLKNLRRLYGIRLGTSPQLDSPLREQAVKKWGNPVPFLHAKKDFFDTIHALVLAANLSGEEVRILPSADGDAFHVLGTSYNRNNFQPPESTTILLLNSHYFHCSIVERLNQSVPNLIMADLLNYYGGSRGLLDRFPQYKDSDQKLVTDRLLLLLANRGVI